MRIFHLVPNMNFGGLQEIVRELSLFQRRAGHEVTIGCWTNVSNNVDSERQLEDAGVRILYLRRGAQGQRISGKKYLFLKLKGELGAGRADILHVHNPFFHYLYGALAARAAGSTKVMLTLHATVWLKGRARWKATFWTGAMLSHSIVSVCEEVEQIIRRRFLLPGSRFSVIENGIDLRRFLAVPARPARETIVIGMIGRMSREKNHGVLLEAFARLLPKYDNLRLRLLGSGELEPQLRELTARLGLESSVEFCGFSTDTPRYLESFDIYVLASESEAMPLSLLEAIASGLPVVATRVGNVPRMVELTQAGWLCRPGDVDDLTKALEEAILCPDRSRLGELARRQVSKHFSSERMGADYDAHYRFLLGEA